MDIHKNGDVYVCITHKCIAPCEEGDNHLLSNWVADIDKIMKTMEEK